MSRELKVVFVGAAVTGSGYGAIAVVELLAVALLCSLVSFDVWLSQTGVESPSTSSFRQTPVDGLTQAVARALQGDRRGARSQLHAAAWCMGCGSPPSVRGWLPPGRC